MNNAFNDSIVEEVEENSDDSGVSSNQASSR